MTEFHSVFTKSLTVQPNSKAAVYLLDKEPALTDTTEYESDFDFSPLNASSHILKPAGL